MDTHPSRRDRRRDHPRSRRGYPGCGAGRGGSRSTSSSCWPTSRCCSTPGCAAHFADTLAAVSRFVPPDRLRWVSFGHVEADECGALDARPRRLPPRRGRLRRARMCAVARRPARASAGPGPSRPGEALDLGGRRIVAVPTPHAPAQPGSAGALRGDDGHAAVRRPVHPARPRARAADRVAGRCGARRRGRAAQRPVGPGRARRPRPPGRLRPPHAGHHARHVVRGRRRRARSAGWPTRWRARSARRQARDRARRSPGWLAD